jgi:PIN domain nuclease of toxin-antitoxin system
VDVETDAEGAGVQVAEKAGVILLDTHAVIWLARGHRRARSLQEVPRLFLSPATILELQFLTDAGRIRLASTRTAAGIAESDWWRLDEPPAGRWFDTACELSWTRDPFDRLLAAHARLRGWKLATADVTLLARLAPSETFAL